MLGFGHSEKLETEIGHEDAQNSCWQMSVCHTSGSKFAIRNIAGFQGKNNHSSALSFFPIKFLTFPPLDCRLRPLDLGTRVHGPEQWGPGFDCAGSCSIDALKLCRISGIRQVG